MLLVWTEQTGFAEMSRTLLFQAFNSSVTYGIMIYTDVRHKVTSHLFFATIQITQQALI